MKDIKKTMLSLPRGEQAGYYQREIKKVKLKAGTVSYVLALVLLLIGVAAGVAVVLLAMQYRR